MYQFTFPPDHLKSYIDYMWVGEKDTEVPGSFLHLANASTKIELQFHYCGQVSTIDRGLLKKVANAGFFGPSDSYKKYYADSKHTAIFGIRFHPHSLALLFNIPALELTNNNVQVEELLGRDGNELTERVCNAVSFVEKTRLLISFVEKRIHHNELKYLHFNKLFEKINRVKGYIDLNTLADQTFLSKRQFERNFKELTGFSLKKYKKIYRFENFIEKINLINNPSSKSLTQLAFEYGYYDQPHLNRHFKELCGLSPKKYLKLLSK